MPYYTLSFGRSSSPHYAAATALAAQIPGTTVTGGDGVAVHAVDGGRSAVPCRLLARALPYDWGSDVPADAVGARLIQGLAQRDCVTACPAYDAPTVVAGMRAHLRDCRREADWPLSAAAEDDWLARLLIDVDLGDES